MARPTRSLTAAALLATLAGCSVANPITTQLEYAPSDGVRVELSENVSAENLMILTRGEGREGHLLGAVVNRSDEDVAVEIELAGGPVYDFDLGPQDVVNFADAELTPASVDDPPGATLQATLSLDQAGSQEAFIPVLDGTLPAYERYLERN
ncbi:hypothetical protein [Georgenia subflava]|uniref:DNA modification methylase n=1 Tax=Georgenia subflava TaxID=1622177 RepID=A0A6N7EGK6_9MICO|nr:hypothetical protein [Georgenia subflava]MPV36303.1 hypothetical protein [Georgenia subflava]